MAGRTDKTVIDKITDAARAAGEKLATETARLVGGDDAARERAEGFAERAEEHRDHVRAADAKGDYERALMNVVATFAAFPKSGPHSLRFADGETFLDGEQIVAAADLRDDANGGVTYGKPIDFAPESPVGRITEAWLIAGSGEAMKCDLGSVGLDVGGGRAARIPAGHLLF